MSKITDCDTCGTIVHLVWDESARRWTGKCWTCGDIVYVDKELVRDR